ncbi:hypothetical protein L1D14_25505 [Vibrio tubiashii]|uniref:hypothetical protein n=1 Tax=Vibrio tubiashii TaxID=29498 RepID=UPI001EFDFA86|nr:hypothetical protein [Vibrio tubiashii]MCG9579568.1 hypothetical protein [Vibrio tubiashii]
MTKSAPTERTNSIWLHHRSNIRATLTDCFEQATDFRFSQPRALQLPVNPIECHFYNGLNGLLLMHHAYSVSKELNIFDCRFAHFHDFAKHDLRLRKGSHAVNIIHVSSHSPEEHIDTETGSVATRYSKVENVAKGYRPIFHAQQLVNQIVPTSSAIIDQIKIPFHEQHVMDRFIGDWVRALSINVRFVRTYQTAESDVKTNAVVLPLPQLFQRPDQYLPTLFHHLILLTANQMPLLDFDSDLTGEIGSLLICNALFLRFERTIDADLLESKIATMSSTELFMHALVAEQAMRSALKQSGQLSFVLHAQSHVTALVCKDFLLFSKSEKTAATASREATLQSSEPINIRF